MVLLSNLAFHCCCCCCYSSSRQWLYSIFYLFFIIKQGRDGYRSSMLSSLRGVCTSARLSFSSRFSIKPRRPQWMPVLIRPVSCRLGLGAWKGSSPPSSAPAACWHVAGKAKLVSAVLTSPGRAPLPECRGNEKDNLFQSRSNMLFLGSCFTFGDTCQRRAEAQLNYASQ